MSIFSIPSVIFKPHKGLSLGSTDVDKFLLEKVQHKLNYWASRKLFLSRRKMIVNNIILSTLWYFVNVWGGTKKGILIINRLLKNYLWAWSNHNCRCWIAWDQCCGKKKDGGLSLVNPIQSTEAFLPKWVVHALKPISFNL
jgi:hypothetical protein